MLAWFRSCSGCPFLLCLTGGFAFSLHIATICLFSRLILVPLPTFPSFRLSPLLPTLFFCLRSHTLLVETRAVPLAANNATRIDYLTASAASPANASAATAINSALPLPPHLLHVSDPSTVIAAAAASSSSAASALSASALASSTYLTQYQHARGSRYDWSTELVGVAQPMAANQRFFFRVAPAAGADHEEESLFEETEKEPKGQLVCYYDSLDQRVNATKRLVVRLAPSCCVCSI